MLLLVEDEFRILALVSCLILVLLCTNRSNATDRPARQQTEILFLTFADPDLPDLADLIEETQTQIIEGRTTPVHFSFEYLDPSLSLSDHNQKRKLQSYLLDRYRGHSFKLVITIGEQATALADEYRMKLFPDASLVFFVVDPADRKWLSPKSGRTGVIQNPNYAATLKLALAQNPGTRHVVLIAGSSEAENVGLKKAREQFRPYEQNVDFREWTNVTFLDLSSRLATLEPSSVVLFLNFLYDAAGEQFVPAQILPGLANRTNRPIYGIFSSFVGRGVVGGSVADLREVGRILGRSAVSVLNGQGAEQIAVTSGDFQRYVFDWPQLRRWGISEEQLPPGSSVLHWQISPWQLYRWRIISLFALVAIQAFLIALLLRTRAKQKQVETRLLQKQEELSEAQRLARIGSWQWEPSTDALSWSDTLYDVLGVDQSTVLVFKAQEKLFSPESWERLTKAVESAFRSGAPYELSLQATRPDGKKVWLTLRGEMVREANGRVVKMLGTMQDVTEERQLQEVFLKYAAIVESSDDAIISEDLSGTIVTWNRGAQRTFGFTQDEAIGRPISIIIPPSMRDQHETMMSKVKAGETVHHYQTVRMDKQGNELKVLITNSPIKNSQGTIIGCSKIVRDLSELMRAQEEVKQSEERFAKAFRRAPLAIAITNAHTQQYIDVNETFEDWSGFRRDEIIGRTPVELGIWENVLERQKLVEKILVEGSIRDLEWRYRTKQGKHLVGLTSAELIEIGGQPCILAVVADITDRKKVEQKLQESERRFRLMADSAPVLMWLSGPDRLCTDFNQEWLRFTGRDIREELGEGWTKNVHPDDLPHCMYTYTRAFDARQEFVMEYRLRRHDGQFRWLLDRGVPRFLEDGSFAGFIGCCIDITDEKEAKVVRAELSGRLINAQEEERARIARELHDDINQRLALLANRLQELERSPEIIEQAEQKLELRELWQFTSEIANGIQQLSHRLHPSKLHYLGLAAAVRELCQEFSKLQKIEVQCTAHNVPAQLDETVGLSLYRAVQEALRNVAKHSQAHHVKVELTGNAAEIRVRVSDDGVGFDSELTKYNHGLGLISMQERLRLVGGEFSLWSRPSLGTQIEGVVRLRGQYAQSA